jgi:hypothetical protein
MGLASIWAFLEPKYQNTPDIVPVSYSIAPGNSGGILV